MQTVQMIIEKADNLLWGRVNYEDNLLVDSADTLEDLRANMQALLLEFHDAKDVEFTYTYDISVFFEQYAYLKISKIAEYAGMNPGLLRHYSAGSKHPSAEQVKRIEDAVHRLAQELASVHLVAA